MADTKLSALIELAATPANDDEVYIRDVSEAAATESKRITVGNLMRAEGKGARAYHNIDQAIANSTWAAIALNSELYDTDSIHDNVTNNSRLTCKTAGVYVITGHIDLEESITGLRSLYIRLNGTTSIAEYQSNNVEGGPGFSWITSIATNYKLAVNDYVELMIRQTSGGSLDLRAYANTSPHLAMQRIG